MRKTTEYLIIIPFLLTALVIGLFETIIGKSIDEEWYRDYRDSNRNHGQGPRRK